MEVIEHNTEKLILRSEGKEIDRLEQIPTWSIRLVGGTIIGFVFYVLFRVSEDNWQFCFLFAMITVGGASAITLLSELAYSFAHPIKTCVLDKTSECVTIIKKVIWRWWPAHEERHALQDIRAVTLWRDSPRNMSLGLRLKLNKTIEIAKAEFVHVGKQRVAETAELVSTFVSVPLEIDLGSEVVIKVPQALSSDARVIPVVCPRCGGQLPIIHQELSHTTCEYCGTNMLVEWEGGDISMSTINSVVSKPS